MTLAAKKNGAGAYGLFIALMACVWLYIAGDTGMDADLCFMIPEGEDILASGIKHTNTFTYFEEHAIVVQQWLYCVALALARRAAGNAGMMAFAGLWGVLVAVLQERIVSAAAKDRFWGCLVSALCCGVVGCAYWNGSRPENVTIALLLTQCMALDDYKKNGRPWALAALPAVMILEINLHASMWMFHFCVLAAYLVPMKLGKAVRNSAMKIDRPLAIASLSMLPAMLLNPYGIDAVTYTAKSTYVFTFAAGCIEQNATAIITLRGTLVILVLAAIGILCLKGGLESHEFWLAAGFAAVGATTYHNCMFLPIPAAYLAAAAFRNAPPMRPAAEEMPPRAAMSGKIAMILASAALMAAASASVPGYDKYPDHDAALEARLAMPGDYACIAEPITAGYLEYNGIRKVFRDTRPELAGKKINGKYEAMQDETWFLTGNMSSAIAREYDDLDDYLHAHDVRLVADIKSEPAYPYLCGWVSCSDEWVLASDPQRDAINVWVRP